MALDSFGNVFIADAFNNRVRKIDASGIITTIGGTNSFGYSGDGGAAVNAKLWNPSGLALDNSGNVYIADVNNSRIRKVTTNGTISTVVGNGTNGFYGDGGQATNAEIHGSSGVPYGMCFDSLGNLYIADSLNGRIRKIDTNGVITTVAVLTYPINIAIDVPGNIFVADGSVVRKIDTNFVITTVAGGGSVLVDGGQATNAQIFPFGLAVDPTGNLFIGDITNNRRGVRKVDTNGIITTVAGIGSLGNSGDGGLATDAAFGCCYSLQFDLSGNLLIMDQLYSVVRRLWFSGLPTLPLAKLFPNMSGSYQVIVTGSSGSVTSNVANLTLVYPPIFTPYFLTNSSQHLVAIEWSVFQPSLFQVQYLTNLTSANWFRITNVNPSLPS